MRTSDPQVSWTSSIVSVKLQGKPAAVTHVVVIPQDCPERRTAYTLDVIQEGELDRVRTNLLRENVLWMVSFVSDMHQKMHNSFGRLLWRQYKLNDSGRHLVRSCWPFLWMKYFDDCDIKHYDWVVAYCSGGATWWLVKQPGGAGSLDIRQVSSNRRHQYLGSQSMR